VTSLALDQLAGCLEPVSAALPVGVDARLEPEHELLRREIAKLSAVESAAPDWPLVSSVGLELLTVRSKDLLVAVYVACSLAVQQPLLGAAHGTALLVSLISRFGALLFPVRARARVGALAWYLEWLGAQLDRRHAWPQPEVSSLRGQLQQLREAATVLLGDDAPSFSAVLRSCERLERSAVEPAAVEPATVERAAVERAAVEPAAVERAAVERAAVEANQADAFPSRGAALARVSATQRPLERATATHSDRPPPISAAHSGGDAGAADSASARYVFGAPPEAPPQLQAYVARAGALLVELARCRFALDRKDARSYRWLRTGLWLRWERAPQPNRRGRTDLDGPSPTRQVELSRAVKAEQWDDVLALSEQLLVKNPLWLDANRCSALALDKLGDGYASAREQVVRDTQALLARLPQLATLVFSDGTPLASPDTVRWLLPATISLPVVAAEGKLAEPLRERLLRRERAASVEVDELLRASGSARSSFLLRLELAALLEHAGQSREAILVYRGLERDLDTFQLERWEPELALRVLSPLWKLSSTKDGGSQAEADRTGARLAQLSTSALL